jgi:hypothetical protein
MRFCVCGDFNAVRSIEERRSSSAGQRPLDTIALNCFIDEYFLINLPLCGRKFTWYRGDDLSMSRLDSFLLSEEWCLSWPNCRQDAHLRGLSDHFALVLASDEANWGLRPLRMLKCWRDVPGYSVFVKEKWQSLRVDGWGGFILKEKLKLMKGALKEWHLTHSQNLSSRIDSLKVRLAGLDLKGEEDTLSEAELKDLHGVTTGIHSLSRLQGSINWQQSRSRWLRKGDANSKYFHSMLASRRRGNSISSVQVDGITLEGVQPIRQAVFTHFASHFKARNMVRPGVENLRC